MDKECDATRTRHDPVLGWHNGPFVIAKVINKCSPLLCTAMAAGERLTKKRCSAYPVLKHERPHILAAQELATGMRSQTHVFGEVNVHDWQTRDVTRFEKKIRSIAFATQACAAQSFSRCIARS